SPPRWRRWRLATAPGAGTRSRAACSRCSWARFWCLRWALPGSTSPPTTRPGWNPSTKAGCASSYSIWRRSCASGSSTPARGGFSKRLLPGYGRHGAGSGRAILLENHDLDVGIAPRHLHADALGIALEHQIDGVASDLQVLEFYLLQKHR